MIKEFVERYSNFVTRHPLLVIVLVILITVFAIQMAGTIQTKKTEPRDFLPKDEGAIGTLFAVEDEFGSTNIVYYVVEVDPHYTGSDEVSDVRDPKVLRYMNQLSDLAIHTQDVLEVTSPASVLRNINDRRLPLSRRDVLELTYKNGLLDSYVSRDYALALVRIKTTDDVDLENLELELEKIITQVPEPPGIKTSLGGSVMESRVMEKTIGPDMAKTSIYSLIGILAIILLLFRSIKYGFTPMTTIIFGSIWAMGYVGLIGMGLTSQTSGVLSMIMGIGIDFGIQVVTRYRLELPGKSPEYAMGVTLNNVIIPMSTTTLASLIGFGAMSLGKLTFLAQMGTMMSYGVVTSMFAAITVVPALIIIFDRVNLKTMFKNLMSKYEVIK